MPEKSAPFSANARSREKRTAQSFATPEQMKRFVKIWREAASNHTGKPEWDEWDVELRNSTTQKLTEDLPEGKSRIEHVNEGAAWYMTPDQLLRADSEDESNRRKRQMDKNVSARSGDRYSITLEGKTAGDRRVFWQSMESIHGVDFYKAIDARITAMAESGEKRPVRILIMGGDAAFFNDELRHKYGEKVEVMGTTVETAYSRIRKTAMREAITDPKNPLNLSDEMREYLGEVITDDIHPNDRKWRSIVQMQDYPEFDMIIDTYGELINSYLSDHTDETGLHKLTIRAALSKLLPGGDLYIAWMPTDVTQADFETYVPGHGDDFSITQKEDRLNKKRDELVTTYTIHRNEHLRNAK